jgi:biotin operon repressor
MASEAVKEQPEGQTVDEIVIELANALNRRGRKPRDIAKTLGRTEQAVWSKIRMLRRQNKLGLICASHPRAGQCLVADDDGAVG